MSTEFITGGRKFLIPTNLNIEEVISQNPPSFDYSFGFFIYVIDLLGMVPSWSKEVCIIDGFVPLNAQLLQTVNRHYRKHLDYLVTNGIFEEDSQYFVGEKSRGFRLGSNYFKYPLSEIEVSDKKFLKKIEKQANVDFKATVKYDYLWQWFNDGNLKIDVESASKHCYQEFGAISTPDRNDCNKLHCNLCKIQTLANQRTWFTVDKKGKRLHTIFTSLNKSLKPFISYDGQPLVSVDIKNSQPYLAIKVLKDFYSNQPINPTLTTSHTQSIMLVNQAETLTGIDVQHYIDLVVSGQFYEYMEERFREKFGNEYFTKEFIYDFDTGKAIKNTKTPRQLVKTGMFTIFFSQNKLTSHEKKLFKEIFPNVLRVFEEIKRVHHNALACQLQRLEARIVLGKACKEISLKEPQIPLFTIHDSIVTTLGNEDFVKEVLVSHLEKEIGYAPDVKFEYWQESDLKKAA